MFDAAISDNIIQRNIHIDDGCVRRVLDASVAADIDFTYGDVVVFRVLSSTPGDRVVLRSEVFEKQNTCISAVCLDSQSRDPNEPRLIVHAGDGSSREIKLLDMRVFVENAEVVLKQLYAWSKRSVVARPRFRQIYEGIEEDILAQTPEPSANDERNAVRPWCRPPRHVESFLYMHRFDPPQPTLVL